MCFTELFIKRHCVFKRLHWKLKKIVDILNSTVTINATISVTLGSNIFGKDSVPCMEVLESELLQDVLC